MKTNLRTVLLTGTAFLAVSTYGITQAQAVCTPVAVGLIATTTPFAGAGISEAGAAGAGCQGSDAIDFGANNLTGIQTPGGDIGGAGAASAVGTGGYGGIGTSFTTFTGNAITNINGITGGAGGAGSATGDSGGIGGAGIYDNSANNAMSVGAGPTGAVGGAGGAGGPSGGAIGGAGANGGIGADIEAGGTNAHFVEGDATGGAGGAGGSSDAVGSAASTIGGIGGAGLVNKATGSNIAGGSFTGGVGGAGGANSGGGVGGVGGLGGDAADIGGATVTFSSTGTVTGGAGGAGGAGGGAVDSIGAAGGAGIVDTSVNTLAHPGSITTAVVVGGKGGAGGANNSVAGTGGAGASGGDGADIEGTYTNYVVNGAVTGGAGGSGGASTSTANNSAGGTGGAALNVTGTNDTITLNTGAVLLGGAGGAAGTGGSGTAGSIGATGGALEIGGTGEVLNDGAVNHAVTVNFEANGSLTNNAVITGNITETGNRNITLTNTGTINGNINLPGSGVETLILSGGTVTGTITLGSGANIVDITGTSTYAGTIAGTVATTELSAGNLTVTSYTAGTTLKTNLTSTGTTNTIGSVTSTGGLVNLAGETVNVGAPVGPIATGTAKAVVLATGNGTELVGDDPAAVTSNTRLYTFTVAPGTLALGQEDDLLLIATAVPGFTRNDAAINGALITYAAEGIVSPTPGEATLNTINATIAAAPTAAAAHNDLQSLTPTVDGGAQGVAFNAVQETQDIADTRMAALRTGDATSGVAAGASSHGAGMWLEGYGQHSSQDMIGDTNGYSANTWGGAVGFDSSALMNKSIVGFALNYGHSIVNSSNANTTLTDVGNYGLNVYGTYDLGQKMFADAQAGYAYNTVDSYRHNADLVGGTAHGSTNSDQYSAKVGLGRDYPASNGMTLTPTASAGYTHLNTAGYTETGAAVGSNLVVGSNSQNALDLGVGLKAGWKLKAGDDGSVVKPALHAGYAYAAIDDAVQTSASFSGDPAATAFTTTGATPGRNIFDVGANIVYATAANWDFSANYDLQLRQAYSSNTGELRATAHF